jgi:CRISPR/Cas system-associated exonuclease Cas4 (RecB family)
MIDLEDKKDFATGIKSKNIYTPNQNKDFKISRSKFDDFRKCPRCFYCDVVKGYVAPGTPGWALNSKTDELLKKEFDKYREEEKPHPFFLKNNLENIIPYKNNNIAKDVDGNVIKHSQTKKPYKVMDAWRTNSKGISIRFKDTNLILYGSVDDIWMNTKTNELIVVDYKSQGSSDEVNPETYFNAEYRLDYQRQLNFYSYLLNNQQGDLSEIKVSKIAYLYVVNARGLDDGFNNQLIFEPKLVPVQISDDGIEDNLQKMFDLMNSKNIPEPNPKCKNCAYSRRRSDLDLELNEDNIENFLIRFAEDKIFLESASKLLNEKKLLKTDNKNE